MRLTITPERLAETLRKCGPLTAPAARRRKGKGRVTINVCGDSAVLSGPECLSGKFTRPMFEADLEASAAEEGSYRIADSRAALNDIRARFKRAAANEDVPVETRNGVLYVGDVAVRGAGGPPRHLMRLPSEVIEVPLDRFLDTARRLFPLMSDDPSRPRLTRFEVRGAEGGVRLAATDMFRLGCEVIPASHSLGEGVRSLEREVVKAALRLGEGGDKKARLGWDETGAHYFSGGGLRLRLGGGNFTLPNLNDLLDEYGRRGEAVLLDPAGVAKNIMGLQAPSSGRGTNGVPVRIWWREGRMEAAFGDGDPVVVGNMERGPEAASAFRRDRLASALAAVPSPGDRAYLRFPLASPNGSFLRPLGITGPESMRALVMPECYDPCSPLSSTRNGPPAVTLKKTPNADGRAPQNFEKPKERENQI